MKRNMVNLLGALAVFSALNLQLSTAWAQGTGYTLLTTFTNPTPAGNDWFSYSVAAVESDRVLIGAFYDNTGADSAGAAYLLSTNGVLLTTFTNPTPADYDVFGFSVAATGSDWVLIGAPGDDTGASGAGAAYLFGTNGALLTTFTNPMPYDGDSFGRSVAAVGSDRVLIGAIYDDTGADSAGAAYLLSTNGALLTTFTNPTPAADDYFGCSVAALGSELMLIGAFLDDTGTNDAGAAYLFSTNGALLTIFTNPTPAGSGCFGESVAAMGTDRVLIGAPCGRTDSTNFGAAYLFNANGALLTIFTNPTPVGMEGFGESVAAVGNDRVLIGAIGDDTGANDAGAAYLFSTNGALLATFTNPAPAAGDWFGHSVAAVGTDQVLIGALLDDAGAGNAGAAYLFSLAVPTPEAPSLTIRLTSTNMVAVSWPSPWIGWTLQENTNGVASVNWSNAPGTLQDDGTNKTLVIVPPTENRFYRLFKP